MPQDSHRDPPSVVLIVDEGSNPFELACACEVFGARRRPEIGRELYRFRVVTPRRRVAVRDAMFTIGGAGDLGDIDDAHTVFVPNRPDTDTPTHPAVIKAVQRAHQRGARLVGLCTGAYTLAEAGLLDGRPAAVHWQLAGDFRRRHPKVDLHPDVLFVDDGDILTSAGSAASIDLCLHLVRLDYGTEVATQLARQLVVPPQREGGQAQYIDAPMPVLDGSSLFAGTVDWLQEHLHEEVTVDDLAARAAMSPRTFARRFLAATGTTPYQWLTQQRVQLAQRLLETSDLPIDSVAQKSGFSTGANLRKHFSRAVHTSPQAYRRTFAVRRAS